MAAGKKTCGFEVLLDNGQTEITLDVKRAKKIAKFHEGNATIVKRCLVNEYKDGKQKKK
jgi:uncharacterized protein YheU (UPF0270 family)